MSKIILIANTGLIRIKFQKVLNNYGFSDVDTMSSYEVVTVKGELTISKASIIFIDSDNREIDIKSMIEKLISLVKPKPYLITITSHADVNFIKQLLSYGCDDVLAKPYSEIELMEKVFKADERPSLSNTKDVLDSSDIEGGKRYMPTWHDDLGIGIESIDNEHKSLIESYEMLYQKMRKGEGHIYCLNLLKFLEEYVIGHFEHEEAFLAEIGYKQIDKHHKLHEDFRKDVETMVKDYENSEVDNSKLLRFNLFFKNWLMHHILIEDRKYMKFYKEIQIKNENIENQ